MAPPRRPRRSDPTIAGLALASTAMAVGSAAAPEIHAALGAGPAAVAGAEHLTPYRFLFAAMGGGFAVAWATEARRAAEPPSTAERFGLLTTFAGLLATVLRPW